MKYSKTLTDSYKTFPNRITERDPYYCNKTDYINILKDFNSLLSEEIIYNHSIVKLPYNLGILSIVKKIMPSELRNRQINYKLTKELNKVVYHTNSHSSNYYGKWYWDKRISRAINQKLYKFKAIRKNNRNLAKYIKETNNINKYLSK